MQTIYHIISSNSSSTLAPLHSLKILQTHTPTSANRPTLHILLIAPYIQLYCSGADSTHVNGSKFTTYTYHCIVFTLIYVLRFIYTHHAISNIFHSLCYICTVDTMPFACHFAATLPRCLVCPAYLMPLADLLTASCWLCTPLSDEVETNLIDVVVIRRAVINVIWCKTEWLVMGYFERQQFWEVLFITGQYRQLAMSVMSCRNKQAS